MITTQEINNDYSFRSIADFNFIVANQTGYLNITHFYESHGKKVKTWLDTQKTAEMIIFLEKAKEVPLICVNNHQNVILNGVYINPRLLVPAVSWVSIKYALAFSEQLFSMATEISELKTSLQKKEKELADLSENKKTDDSYECFIL